MKITRRGFLKAGATVPVFVAVSTDVSVHTPMERATHEGMLCITGMLTRTQLSFYRDHRRKFEAELDESLAQLRRQFMLTYDRYNKRR